MPHIGYIFPAFPVFHFGSPVFVTNHQRRFYLFSFGKNRYWLGLAPVLLIQDLRDFAIQVRSADLCRAVGLGAGCRTLNGS